MQRRPGSGYNALGGGDGGRPALASEAIAYDRAKRKLITLDDEDDEEDKETHPRGSNGTNDAADANEEVDPLDAFMASLAPPPPKKARTTAAGATSASSAAAAAADVTEDEVDPLDAFMASLSESGTAAASSRSAVATPAASSSRSRINDGAAIASGDGEAEASRRRKLELDDDDAHESFLASSERRRAQRLTKLERQAQQRGVSLDSLLDSAAATAGDSDEEDEDSGAGAKSGGAGAPGAGAGAGAGSGRKREMVIYLPPLDHASISYPPFRKQLYTESAELTALPEAEIAELTADFDVHVTPAPGGPPPPRLCYRFDLMGLEPRLLSAIRKQGFDAPTAIQSIAVPSLLSGHDLIALARTGSGKTAAFVWPMVMHVLDQQPALLARQQQQLHQSSAARRSSVAQEQGPVALILAPTRELAEQIYTECFKYLRPFGLRVVPVLGGMQRYEQERSLAAGCEVVVATPGRLMELLSAGSASCSRVTFVVLDEADRMLSLGFEPAVRSILGQIRPDKQLCMFSATFDSRDARVEKLARQFLVRPLRIRVGEGEDGGSGSGTTANKSIRQVVDVLSSPEDKWSWLVSKLPSFLQVGAVLLFVSTIAEVESLVKRLQRHFHGRYSIGALHGDSHQAQRHAVLSSFKKGEVQLLVATDVASRGLDIKGLPTVVNVDPARGSDAHTHRIGRTGRAGREGVAYTLLAASETMDQRSAGMLLDSLEAADSEVPQALRELAEKDKAYMRSRNERIARTQKAAAARGGGRAGMVGGRGGAGAAASYNNVPPPSMHPPPPAGSAAAFPAGGLQGALAFANAYNSKSALPPHPVAPAATSFIGGQSGGAAVGGVHPSRLAQVPGALASAMAAAAAPANVGAAATLPLPPPPPPAAPMMGAAPSVQQVHPSRWSMVPNAQPQHSLPVPPPPPPPSSYPPSTATAYSLPLPPPPPPQVQPQAQTPAASTDGAAAAPPKRRSRWDVSS